MENVPEIKTCEVVVDKDIGLTFLVINGVPVDCLDAYAWVKGGAPLLRITSAD